MKNKVSNFTFEKRKNLFNEDVLVVLRNSDKKLIASLGDIHFMKMKTLGYNPNDLNDVLLFLKMNNYFD